MGSGEKIAELVFPDLGEAHEDRRVAFVVIREIEDFGGLGEEGFALLEVQADHEGVGLGGFVRRGAGEKDAVEFEGDDSVVGGLLDVGKSVGELANVVIGERLPRHVGNCILMA